MGELELKKIGVGEVVGIEVAVGVAVACIIKFTRNVDI